MGVRPRVLYISEIPTPYRLPVLLRLVERPEIDLQVVFCAAAEPDRPWEFVELAEPSFRVMKGWQPRLRTHREMFVYELNPAIFHVLARGRYDVLVVAGYSVFAEQIAIGWARLRGIPYILHSESHLGKSRAPWRSFVKRLVLPRVIGHAAAGLAAGTAASEYLDHYGLSPSRIRIFPNTVDIDAYASEAQTIRVRADEMRRDLSLPGRYLLYVGRLVEGKGVAQLVAAHARMGRAAPPLVLVGEGPLVHELRDLPNVKVLGFVQPQDLIPLYALAEAVAVPSLEDTWGVTVNEALACGTPVVVSDAVGAARDLVQPGVNGFIFPAGDVAALAQALEQVMIQRPLDPCSGRIREWTYDFAVTQFLEAVALATEQAKPD